MLSNLDKYKKELDRLSKTGTDIFSVFIASRKKDDNVSPLGGYQRWYSEAYQVIKQILPDRLNEFELLYKTDKRKAINAETYTIQDMLLGRRAPARFSGESVFDDTAVVVMKFQAQLMILESANVRFESLLFDIRQIVQADLFDSEIEIARELKGNGFLRPAGAVSGVVLEKHLDQVCQNHNIVIRKKHPVISDLNDSLKDAGVLEIHDWRFIQRLGDLRNLCVHNRKQEPRDDEVSELIEGTEKIIKTLF